MKQTAFRDRVPLYIYRFLLLYEASAMFIHLIRVAYYETTGIIDHWVNGFVLILCLVGIRLGRMKTSVNYIMVWMLAYGVLVSIVRQHAIERPYLGQIYHWSVMFLGFNLGYSASLSAERLDRETRVFSYWILTLTWIGYLVLEGYRVGYSQGLYMGYPTSVLILPLCYFVCTSRWVGSAFTLLLLIAGAKRGPLVASLIAVCYIPFLEKMKKKPAQAFALASILVIGMFAGLLIGLEMASYTDIMRGDTPVARALNKLSMTVEEFGGDRDKATAGRDSEIASAVELVSSSWDLMFGQGFGWHVSSGIERQHYVHLVYLNYIVTYGVVGSIPFFLMLVYIISNVGKVFVRPELPRILHVFLYFLVSILIVTFSSSHISVAILFWVVAGFSVRLVHDEKATRSDRAMTVPSHATSARVGSRP